MNLSLNIRKSAVPGKPCSAWCWDQHGNRSFCTITTANHDGPHTQEGRSEAEYNRLLEAWTRLQESRAERKYGA